ncbi:MAG: 50S ribosomal protein L23 [Planctomycetota bacterium]
MTDPYRIVRRPLVTEKGTQSSERHNAYNFLVDPKATKIDIKKAIESLFNVNVTQVRTMVRKGKTRRRGWHLFRTADWKRAMVTLKEGQRIEFV